MTDREFFRGKTEDEVFFNCRIKKYPLGGVEIMTCNRKIFKASDYECRVHKEKKFIPLSELFSEENVENVPISTKNENFQRAMRRARSRVRDLAFSNKFSNFVTLTLNKDKVDRYDASAIVAKLNNWCDNMVRRHDLFYILVPERHKDGALHFHGFFGGNFEVTPSGHFDTEGHEFFNLPQWTLGFSTALPLYGDYQRAVSYVCKYIGKQGEKPAGRWFYSGGNLKNPEIELCNADCIPASECGSGYDFEVPEAGTVFHIERKF